jgi:transcriptional regulator with XRE-family HTH domain
MTFYENLEKALRKRGFTAAELSRRSGVSQTYISNLKVGVAKDVTWEKALKIIEALGMTPSEFAALEEKEDE